MSEWFKSVPPVALERFLHSKLPPHVILVSCRPTMSVVHRQSGPFSRFKQKTCPNRISFFPECLQSIPELSFGMWPAPYVSWIFNNKKISRTTNFYFEKLTFSATSSISVKIEQNPDFEQNLIFFFVLRALNHCKRSQRGLRVVWDLLRAFYSRSRIRRH